jgi:hypothetical protein
MPDVHLPQIDDHEDEEQPLSVSRNQHRSTKTFFKVALEVVLISIGVFLGIAGEQWRESARRHEVAVTSLGRLRVEVETNLKAVERVQEYHSKIFKVVETYDKSHDKKELDAMPFRGLQPVKFAHTAWDLAMATQSLADIDPDLTFALARTYDEQQSYAELSRGILQSMYIRPPGQDLNGFMQAVEIYYGDITLMEPGLVKLYNDLLPKIDHALSQK